MELAIKLDKPLKSEPLAVKKQKVFSDLYQLYIHKVFNSVYRIVNDRALAEDIVQDAFCVAFEQWHRLKDHEKFEGWVRRIAINKAISFLRRNKEILVDEPIGDQPSETEDIQEREIMLRTRVEDVKEAILGLPDGYRAIVTLHLFEDMPQDEIATTLNISPSTVRSQYHRAKKKILSVLKEKYDGK